MKNKIVRMLKILLSIILMFILLTQIEYEEIRAIGAEVKIRILLIAVTIYFISIVINALKWKVLLPKTKIIFLVYLCFKAQFYSTVLPGQLFGEASKLTSWKYQEEDAARVTASVVYDKITGIIGQMLIAMAGFSFSLIGKRSGWYWVLFGIFVVVLGVVLFSAETHVAEMIYAMINFVIKRQKKVGEKLNEFYDAWRYFSTDKKTLFLSVIWGVVNQLMGNLMIYYVSLMLGLKVGFLDYCWIMPMLSLVLLIPVSFAGIGLRDASLTSMLSLYNVPPSKSLVLSTSLLLGQVVAAVIGGIWSVISNLRGNENR